MRTIAFIAALSLFGGTMGLLGAAIIHWLVRPLSLSQFAAITAVFAIGALIPSLVSIAPDRVKAWVGSSLNRSSFSHRERLLWFAAIALLVAVAVVYGPR